MTQFGFGYFERLLPKSPFNIATESERRKIAALLEAYLAAINFYIRSLWENTGRLDKATLALLGRGC
jgi:hypothetical protein